MFSESPLLTGSVSIPQLLQDLLHRKSNEPLDAAHINTLDRIQSLDVTEYSEADVREKIITPLLGVLGYEQDSYFSVNRDRNLKLFGRNIFPDYSVALWSTNFWIIEAKRPKKAGKTFSYSDLKQALRYAVHPEINAALFVLCDGVRVDVYDREESLEHPIVSVEVSNLRNNIDTLRALLSPLQVWFFEKRRIVRQLEKVFDKEFNIRRVEEFRALVERRLESKRQVVANNMRSILQRTDDVNERLNSIRSSEPAELIDSAFFVQFSRAETDAIAETLVQHCERNAFKVVHRIFPDDLRAMNDNFCTHALNLLFHLHMKGLRVNWLPSWLGSVDDLDGVIKSFIGNCLTYFHSDHLRRNVLLCTAAIRRIYKLVLLVDERVWNVGHIRHVITRYREPEDTWEQLASSPERQNLFHLDDLMILGAGNLAREFSYVDTHLLPSLTERRLREYWEVELGILNRASSFGELDSLRNLGEIFPTERICVDYDYLGHTVLCLSEHHKNWKRYILDSHLKDVETLARMHSWQARKWLECTHEGLHPQLEEQTIADRFFLGDLDKYKQIKSAYNKR